MQFTSGQQLLQLCNENKLLISQVMLKRELVLFDDNEQMIKERMMQSYQIMKASATQPLTVVRKTMGQLIGGESQKMHRYLSKNKGLCGGLINKASMYAMGVLETNSSMGLIVAAPTAGASGVVPGCMLAIQEEYQFSDDDIYQALLNASAVGYLIMRNANVAGAQGGCQAEVGSAAAMAASAICELLGGSAAECLDAASHTLMNMLGLVCDPVCGLVEVPCQTRNAIGVANAFLSAQLALAGITNAIAFDEMVDVMQTVGNNIPVTLRETALGGCAQAPSMKSRCNCASN